MPPKQQRCVSKMTHRPVKPGRLATLGRAQLHGHQRCRTRVRARAQARGQPALAQVRTPQIGCPSIPQAVSAARVLGFRHPPRLIALLYDHVIALSVDDPLRLWLLVTGVHHEPAGVGADPLVLAQRGLDDDDGSLGERTHTGTLWTSPPRPPRAPSRLPRWPRETSTRFRRRVAGDPHPPRRSYSEDTVLTGAQRAAR